MQARPLSFVAIASLLLGAFGAGEAAFARKGRTRKAVRPEGLPVWVYDAAAPTTPPEVVADARAAAAVSGAPLVLEKAALPASAADAAAGKLPKPGKLPEQPALIESPKAPPAP